MQDNDRQRGATGDRVRPVALALLEMAGAGERALWRLQPEGPTVLERLVRTAQESGWVQRTVVLAASGPIDEEACAEARRLGVECLRGLGGAAEALRALAVPPEQVVVRLSVRCPLLCPEVLGAAVESLLSGGHDRVSTDLGSGVLPAGLDVEACRARCLYSEWKEAAEGGPRVAGPRSRAHELAPAELGPALERSGRYYASFRLYLEGPEDIPLLRTVTSLLDRQVEPRALGSLLRLLDLHPEWRHTIQHVIQLRPPAAALLGGHSGPRE